MAQLALAAGMAALLALPAAKKMTPAKRLGRACKLLAAGSPFFVARGWQTAARPMPRTNPLWFLCCLCCGLLLAAPPAAGHVPGFYGAGTRCATDPVVADLAVSQVAYFAGQAGGLVLGSSADLAAPLPVQVLSSAPLAPRELAYAVGCFDAARVRAFCAGNTSALPSALPGAARYDPAEAACEPFTQSAMYGGSAAVELRDGAYGCGQGGDRVVAALFATNATRPVTVSVVVGVKERFSLGQLLGFPLFVARLHGAYGNRAYRLHTLTAAWCALLGLAAAGLRPPRRLLPAAAVAAWYLLVATDMALHYTDCLQRPGVPAGSGLGLFLGLVLAAAQLLPVGLAAAAHALAGGPAPARTAAVGWAAGCCAALLGVAGSLYGLGDAGARLAVLAVAGLGGLGCAALAQRQGAVACGLAATGTLAVLLLGFLGSGYWVGPVLLLSQVAAAARGAEPPQPPPAEGLGWVAGVG